jgi:hypothetical protein
MVPSPSTYITADDQRTVLVGMPRSKIIASAHSLITLKMIRAGECINVRQGEKGPFGAKAGSESGP